MEGTLMEHRVTIAIPEADERLAAPIFEAMMREHPEVGPVMDLQFPDGPTTFLMALDAADPHAAILTVVDHFRAAVGSSGVSEMANTTIVDLHAERVPDSELEDRTEFQTA
jgi:hypothetical protein